MIQVELWQRSADRLSWIHRVLGRGDALELDAIGCRIIVDNLYVEAGLDRSPA